MNKKLAILGASLLVLFGAFLIEPLLSGAEQYWPDTPIDKWCDTEAADEMLRRDQHQTVKIQDLLQRTSGDQIVLFAHRGGYTCEEKYSATEGSIANIHKAVRMGIDGYETDIWPTADGEWVSHHDDQLARTTTGSGNIMEHTLAELRELNLKYLKSRRISPETIPTLREFLVAGEGRILFLLQVKHGINERFPELQKIVRDVGAHENTLYFVKAEKKNVDAFVNYIEAGIEDIPSTVVWRVGTVEQLRDLATRIKPRLIDVTLSIPPPGGSQWSDETFDKFFPDHHVQLVEEALNFPFMVMVSRNRTNKYMDFLYEKGVRTFASKKAEIQLHHAIGNGTHF